MPVLNKTNLGSAGLRSQTPNRLHQVPRAGVNVKMSASTMAKPTFGGQTNVQVPPLQVDDLLDFKFPLKTSIREAHIEKWTNPNTGQLYNWQQPPQPAPTGTAYKPIDLDQMLDWKYTKGQGLHTPNATMQSLSAEQAKQMIKEDINQNKQGPLQRAASAAMGLGIAASTMFSGQSANAIQEMYPPNYQPQVTIEAPTIRNLSSTDHANGIIENYIDQFEAFKN